MDLDQVKEAAKKVEDAQAIYRALSEVGEALAIAGNLEATRIALEPKVAALKEDVLSLDRLKDGLVTGLETAREEIVAARAENAATIDTELAAARLSVIDEVRRYRDELVSGAQDLAEKKSALRADVEALSERKSGLQSEIASLDARIDAAEAVLQATSDRIGTLKKNMSDIVEKI